MTVLILCSCFKSTCGSTGVDAGGATPSAAADIPPVAQDQADTSASASLEPQEPAVCGNGVQEGFEILNGDDRATECHSARAERLGSSAFGGW